MYFVGKNTQKGIDAMGNVVQFKRANMAYQGSTHNSICYNDRKIRLIDYYNTADIKNLSLKPADIKCPYECILIDLCHTLQYAPIADKIDTLAEKICAIDRKRLVFGKFVRAILDDDLLFGCIATEVRKISSLDQLYLLNVLKGKFPDETSTIDTLKLVLFSNDPRALKPLEMNSI